MHTLLQVVAAEVMKADEEALLADEMGGLLDALLKVSHVEATELIAGAEAQLAEVRAFLLTYKPIAAAEEGSSESERPQDLDPGEARFPYPHPDSGIFRSTSDFRQHSCCG